VAALEAAATAGLDGEPTLGRTAALLRALRHDNHIAPATAAPAENKTDDESCRLTEADGAALAAAEVGLEALRMLPTPWVRCLSHLATAPLAMVEALVAGVQVTSARKVLARFPQLRDRSLMLHYAEKALAMHPPDVVTRGEGGGGDGNPAVHATVTPPVHVSGDFWSAVDGGRDPVSSSKPAIESDGGIGGGGVRHGRLVRGGGGGDDPMTSVTGAAVADAVIRAAHRYRQTPSVPLFCALLSMVSPWDATTAHASATDILVALAATHLGDAVPSAGGGGTWPQLETKMRAASVLRDAGEFVCGALAEQAHAASTRVKLRREGASCGTATADADVATSGSDREEEVGAAATAAAAAKARGLVARLDLLHAMHTDGFDASIEDVAAVREQSTSPSLSDATSVSSASVDTRPPRPPPTSLSPPPPSAAAAHTVNRVRMLMERLLTTERYPLAARLAAAVDHPHNHNHEHQHNRQHRHSIVLPVFTPGCVPSRCGLSLLRIRSFSMARRRLREAVAAGADPTALALDAVETMEAAPPEDNGKALRSLLARLRQAVNDGNLGGGGRSSDTGGSYRGSGNTGEERGGREGGRGDRPDTPGATPSGGGGGNLSAADFLSVLQLPSEEESGGGGRGLKGGDGINRNSDGGGNDNSGDGTTTGAFKDVLFGVAGEGGWRGGRLRARLPTREGTYLAGIRQQTYSAQAHRERHVCKWTLSPYPKYPGY
jgi:hypothetical protein